MSENKERKLAYGIALACLFVGIIGYSLLPAKTQEEPVRVLYECTGDNVLFEHKTHSLEYGLACTDCHHKIAGQQEDGDKKEAVSCGSCHTGESAYKPAFGEKGLFDHETHSQYYGLSCTDCHHMYDPESGADPQNCGACHGDTGSEYMPGLTDSYHQQCIGCHKDFGTGPATQDCTACHKPRERTEAFHGQCTECHEETGAGPAKEDCQSCHGY
ncbi:MAG: cytochrome c family protein [Desulfobacteraceae bacterium]|nr:cytochrome c family protein [Desulfobacteraceae bacterium]MCF8094787.1 cytochrome c family protein [Desulfobacteraceae bacterium]